MNDSFEWDPEKERANLARHGVTFTEAKSVFVDPLAWVAADDEHSWGEQRFTVLGMSEQHRLLWCIRTVTLASASSVHGRQPAARRRPMKAEYLDDEEMPEFDFSNAVRGAFANRWTPEEREAILRDSAYETVRAMTQYAGEQFQALEAALFTYLVLAANETSHQAAKTAAGLLRPRAFSALPPLKVRGTGSAAFDTGFGDRLNQLASEREWLVSQPPLEPYTGPGSFNHVVDRLEVIYNEARALKAQVDALIENHLARSGLSEQEIERKTEETARLWLAA